MCIPSDSPPNETEPAWTDCPQRKWRAPSRRAPAKRAPCPLIFSWLDTLRSARSGGLCPPIPLTHTGIAAVQPPCLAETMGEPLSLMLSCILGTLLTDSTPGLQPSWITRGRELAPEGEGKALTITTTVDRSMASVRLRHPSQVASGSDATDSAAVSPFSAFVGASWAGGGGATVAKNRMPRPRSVSHSSPQAPKGTRRRARVLGTAASPRRGWPHQPSAASLPGQELAA